MSDPRVRTRPLVGVLLLGTAVFLFAAMNATTKTLSQVYVVPLIMAVRYCVQTLLMLLIIVPTRGLSSFRTTRKGWVLLRSFTLALSSLLLGLGLQRLPVAEAASIGFLAPMVVVLLSRPVLGERVGPIGWLAVVLGFGGVLLIVRPGTQLDLLGVGFIGLNVLAGAFYQLLTRRLAATESVIAMLFQTALVGASVFLALQPFMPAPVLPTPYQLALLVSLGITGGMGHYLLTAAYTLAPASLLSPVNYLELVWAGLIGVVVFGHLPDVLTIVGMAVVATSGLIAAVRSGLKRSSPDAL